MCPVFDCLCLKYTDLQLKMHSDITSVEAVTHLLSQLDSNVISAATPLTH